jgi:hypothetical protein
MKKLIFLVSLLFVVAAINVNAQARTAALDFSAANYFEYTGVAGDTMVSGTGTNIDWGVPRSDLYLYRVEVELQEISGTVNCTAILQGSMNGVDYTEIDTLVNAAGAEAQSASGTVFITDLSTGVAWRYLRIAGAISGDGEWDINYVRFRAVGKND